MTTKPIHILMAEDDEDDQFFFNRALKKITIPTELTIIGDGESLLEYLRTKQKILPDLLFLDVNMPRKNGLECLNEIKMLDVIKEIPVIIYSTSLNDSAVDEFFNAGAHCYLKKDVFQVILPQLQSILKNLTEDNLKKNKRDQFVLSLKTH